MLSRGLATFTGLNRAGVGDAFELSHRRAKDANSRSKSLFFAKMGQIFAPTDQCYANTRSIYQVSGGMERILVSESHRIPNSPICIKNNLSQTSI